ncbi:MAG: hypothetical protein ACTS6G_05730 [Candidatus Hodgkinia cicadicola]
MDHEPQLAQTTSLIRFISREDVTIILRVRDLRSLKSFEGHLS